MTHPERPLIRLTDMAAYAGRRIRFLDGRIENGGDGS